MLTVELTIECGEPSKMQGSSMKFDPSANFLGGYTDNDGTIEFYSRIQAFISDQSIVIDLGAGRAEWFEDDMCTYRRETRFLRPKVKRLIGLDIDEAVFENKSTHENRLIKDGTFPFEDSSADVVIADYVLEHVADPSQFVSEIRRVLRNGGLFCGRTPHILNYVSLAARIIPNRLHSRLLTRVQPERKEEDVFPTVYNLNSKRALSAHFSGFRDYSYIPRADPAYYLGNRAAFTVFKFFHSHLPRALCGNIFVFLVKDER